MVYAETGNYDDALFLSQQEMELLEQTGVINFPGKEESYFLLSEVYFGKGEYEVARDHYRQLFEMLTNRIKQNFSFMNERERENYWRQYRDQLFNAGKYADGGNDPLFNGLVYDAALFSKGILLNSSITVTNLFRQSKDPLIANLYEEACFLRRGVQKEEIIGLQKEEMLRKADFLERELMNKVPAFREYVAFLETAWTDIRSALKTGETAIEFIEYEAKKDSVVYAAAVICPEWNAPRVINLFSREHFLNTRVGDILLEESFTVKEEVSEFEFVLKELYANSHVLYELIWKPLESFLTPDKAVFFSPVGLLNLISIEYLTNPDGVSLFGKYDLHRCSSTREVLHRSKEQHFDTAVLYGGMQYDAPLRIIENGLSAYRVASGDLFRHVSSVRANIDSLPSSQREVEIIADCLQKAGIPTTVISKADAVEESVKGLSGKSPSMLHISTHGITLPVELASVKKQGFSQVNKRVDELALHY